MNKKAHSKVDPTLAPGMDTEQSLNKEASNQEIKEGNYTNVTRLSLDENDPS